MYHRPKLGLLYYIFLSSICSRFVHSLPTIQKGNLPQQEHYEGNYLKTFDKSFFQPSPQVEDTIDEVQKILARDPSLPRLTRGEIEELYEKVTREEYEKSLEQGDVNRAESMRALMLVLPYNTDNNTEENLQELYTRPPVTKVVSSYTSHEPIKFVTADPLSSHKVEKQPDIQMPATTYKPSFSIPQFGPSPTTYHPPAPLIMHQQSLPSITPDGFQPMTRASNTFNYNNFNKANRKPQRFSSHYNAKNADFLRKATITSTVRPVADVLENLGIVSQTQSRHRFSQPDIFSAAESAPQPVISGYVPLGFNLDDIQSYRTSSSLAPKIRADAYTNFKPLNIGEELRIKPEVESYLTRFGIVGGRKRKVLEKPEKKKTRPYSDEPASEQSEIATAKVPSANFYTSKSKAAPNDSELLKLLENLQELEKLNVKTKIVTTTTPIPTTTTTTVASTSTTSKPKETFAPLITNGAPLIIEAKKPRRRIDPNVDINFANAGNQQPVASGEDQLSKLLENLKELEKLQINPENVLKQVPSIAATNSRSQQLSNRFIATTESSLKSTPNTENLDRILKELQRLEKQNSRTTSTTTQNSLAAGFAANDLAQLRKLLSNDQELERLYEKARKNFPTTLKPSTTTTSTSTTTTSTTTTRPPANSNVGFNFNDIEQLQKYLAAMNMKRTSTSTSSTTTTTSTTLPPSKATKKPNIDQAQLEELINRVQDLERRNPNVLQVRPTASTLPDLGFTTRNVNTERSVHNLSRLPANDFANLQELYAKARQAEEASFGQVEISTARTAAKLQQESQIKQNHKQKPQNFAQRLIDITNDTGSGSSLQEVDPDDFIQLQKLLKKVQELERVKIPSTTEPTAFKTNKLPSTATSSLVTSASLHSPSVASPNGGPHIVYAEKPDYYSSIADILQETDNIDDIKLDLPAYQISSKENHAEQTSSKKKSSPLNEKTSSEELHELAYSKLANPMNSMKSDKDTSKYQSFFSSLEDSERIGYQNMQPPVINKMLTKEPPRFIATRKPEELPKSKVKQEELKELQKLLNNAQELEKLGVTLPNELSQQIEKKLIFTNMDSLMKESVLVEDDDIRKPTTPANLYEEPEPSERTAVFSLTTQKSSATKEPRTTTESSVQLPVFSATKIIEAAIKRAASKIGVSTETIPPNAQGFKRRIDDEDLLDDGNDDLMGEFSEINYQLAAPEAPLAPQAFSRSERSNGFNEKTGLTNNAELHRLIANLEELQKLNINLTPQQAQQADSKYLETLKEQLAETEESKKNRRQSVPSTTTSTVKPTSLTEESTSSPTRLNLNSGLSLTDEETFSITDSVEKPSSTTEESSTLSTSTTEESRNGSLADLEDSFGPDPNTESPPPAKKKNGFYFLADWNSFLEVGDGDDQVVVRLSPKIGDPRLFLPVKIP